MLNKADYNIMVIDDSNDLRLKTFRRRSEESILFASALGFADKKGPSFLNARFQTWSLDPLFRFRKNIIDLSDIFKHQVFQTENE